MADAGRRLPDRVLLYGVTGSGTSTAALAIGDRTDRPVTLVDELTSITREPRCNGNVETWRAIARRDSIIVWHFRSFARKRARMRAWAASSDGPTVLLFRRPVTWRPGS